MKNNFPTVIVLGVSLTMGLIGCSHKTDANSELAKAAAELGKNEPTPAPVAAPTAQPVQSVAAPVETPAPAQQMSQAMAAYKAGQLEDAVTRLQKLRATPVMTPQQRIALNDAMGAVMTEIYSLAAKGDARAIQAVKQYELMQTHSK